MKTSKSSDVIDKAQLSVLRKQLYAFPEALREQARIQHLMNEDIKQRDLQDFQMSMIGRIEMILHKRLLDEGINFRKFKIGGYERGCYERFYRVEPAKYMSKPQFATALYRCFGEELKKNESAVSKLYDSFDVRGLGEMDWRSFLLLLVITMQPDLPCVTYLRWAFALYASSGSYDLECRDPIRLDSLKSMICVPIFLVKRVEIVALFDEAWSEFSVHDSEAAVMVRDKLDPEKGSDALLISYSMFNRMITVTSFSKLMEVTLPYGKKDKRPWIYRIEEYYHPTILHRMKIIRRNGRNEDEVVQFLAMIIVRVKRNHMSMWRGYVDRRKRMRYLIIQASIRWKNDQIGTYFDFWKATMIRDAASSEIGRIARGFCGRRRTVFLQGLQKRSVKVQSAARQLFHRLQYKQLLAKRTWAATTIQRHNRGYMCRRRVKTTIEAIYDIGLRNIAIERARWIAARQLKAVLLVQCAVRRWRFSRAVAARVKIKVKTEYAGYEMDLAEKQKGIDRQVYRKQLQDWFVVRKEEYDRVRELEEHDAQTRMKIYAYRNRAKILDAEEKEKLKIQALEKEEENRIELWLQQFEERKISRTRAKEAQCRRCLLVPETPDDVALKKVIMDRAKKHVKTVLRKADKQKIPMEIPEAKEIAVDEIIEEIVAEELELVRQEGRKEAEDYTNMQEQKLLDAKVKLEKERKRKRVWGAIKIQGMFRCFAARRLLRMKAYKRFEKRFDPTTFNYYYTDVRSRKSMWTKPLALGHYDIDAQDGYVVLYDPLGDMYFYNEKSWEMTYDQPHGTILCARCHKDFAVARLQSNKRCLCDPCSHVEVNAMMQEHQLSATDIMFRPFMGNSAKASTQNFAVIKMMNWQAYLMKLDPTLKVEEKTTSNNNAAVIKSEATRKLRIAEMKRKARGEPETEPEREPLPPPTTEPPPEVTSAPPEEPPPPAEVVPAVDMSSLSAKQKAKLKKREEDRQLEEMRKLQESFEENIVVSDLCSKCKAVPARVQCNMCMTYFCERCYHSNHRKPPWTAHSFVEVNKHIKPLNPELAGSFTPYTLNKMGYERESNLAIEDAGVYNKKYDDLSDEEY